MKYALRIKTLRKSLGYNQTQFGEIFGVSQPAISAIEKGAKNPSKTLVKFLEYRYGKELGDDKKQKRIGFLKESEHDTINDTIGFLCQILVAVNGSHGSHAENVIQLQTSVTVLAHIQRIAPEKLFTVESYLQGLKDGLKNFDN